ncbi:MAG: hypothetical protein CME61_01555 [Halobacteriovoraceae bacterium]|nr:hypothetical protein [Halobacteriovoraceae bacterium]|tara:strand:- start:184 stop:687 length:504 start_codon:yes stop_codon:yes gene_type:complete
MTSEEKEQYRTVINLWQSLCGLHQELYEVTCEEYHSLLASSIEETNKILNHKKEVMNKITLEEEKRKKLVNEVLGPEKLSSNTKFSDLKEHFNQFEIEKVGNHLNNFNLILINTINKIKEQNKKNQLFINRAIHSLEGLNIPKGENKQLSIYNNKGKRLKKLDLKGV